MKRLLVFSALFFLSAAALAQQPFNGAEVNLGNLYRMSNAKTRSISPENFTA